MRSVAERLDAKPAPFHVFGMAKKTTGEAVASLRGPKLIKKAIEAGRAEALSDPEPVAAVLLKKLTLPNGEPISPSMKELLKVDSLWLGIEFDDEEGDIESVSLEDLIEDEFGKEALTSFGEAIDLFGGECIVLGGASDALRFLYVGEADESGEYAVLTATKDPAWIGGFVPFDVWVAQELGVLDAGATTGAAPAAHEATAQALADLNGDGRLGFEPKPGERDEAAGSADDDDEDEDDEDEETEESEDTAGSADTDDADELDEEDDADEDEEEEASKEVQ